MPKGRQHPDFPGGHPPEYYPSLRLLNFTEQTGYGVFSLRWPSTPDIVCHAYYYMTLQYTYTTHVDTHTWTQMDIAVHNPLVTGQLTLHFVGGWVHFVYTHKWCPVPHNTCTAHTGGGVVHLDATCGQDSLPF